jgi:hypothetical protein
LILLHLDQYETENRQQAEEDRLSIELDLLEKDVHYEIVLLEASSEEELRRTHRRYFEQLDQLLTPTSAHKEDDA